MRYSSQAFAIRETQIIGQASYFPLDIKTTLSNISSPLKGPTQLTSTSVCDPCQIDVFLFQLLYFYEERGSSGVNVLTQIMTPSVSISAPRDVLGREFDTGLGWHSEPSNCARQRALCLIQPCVGIKTGLLFIHCLSHCFSLPHPHFLRGQFGFPLLILPSYTPRPRFPQ